jgi:hypothetical protein
MADVLSRQGAASGIRWSLARDSQLRDQLEATFAAWGNGVVAGDTPVSAVTGYTVRVHSGTQFVYQGVAYTLAADQDYTAAVASATLYLWGKIVRTAATQTDPNALDSYALSLTHSTSFAEPAAGPWIPLRVWTTDGSGTVGGTFLDPPGKYLNLGIEAGSGTPEAIVTAPPGTIYGDVSGDLWIKHTGTGNTGWVRLWRSGGDTATADQSMGGFKLTDLDTPAAADDAATKDYVDTAVGGAGGALASEVVGAPNITVGAESSNTIVVSVQFRDVDGNNISARMSCLAWLADSANAAPSTTIPDGGWDALTAGYTVSTNEATGAGGNVKELASGPTGSIGIDISHAAGARTWILHVRMGNQVYTGTVTFA